jgi:hypothetical protein
VGKYNFIPRTPQRFVRETSFLASPLNFDSRAHNWKQLEASLRRNQALTDQSSQIRQQLGAMANAPGVTSGFHPFKIYPPSPFWPNSASYAKMGSVKTPPYIWRTVRVRNGRVCTTHAKGIDVDGTDQVDLPYDENFLFEKNGVTPITDVQEYVINENLEFFYFWVEIYTDGPDTLAVLRYGPDPTVSSYTDPDGHNPAWDPTPSTNPWTNWDTPDSTHFLIGWCDTKSQGTPQLNPATGKMVNNHLMLIRQLLVTDILVSAVGNVDCPYG